MAEVIACDRCGLILPKYKAVHLTVTSVADIAMGAPKKELYFCEKCDREIKEKTNKK